MIPGIMEQKQRLFIYDRKEFMVLIILGVMVAVFAFTLGVHLGKSVSTRPAEGIAPISTDPLKTEEDSLPARHELAEEEKKVDQAADETLTRSLQEEVSKTGIRVGQPKPVELPKETVSKEGGATTLSDASMYAIPAALRPAPDQRYTLQIGSYKNVEDAKLKIEALEALGEKPYLRAAQLKDKGKWYRVYIGGYDTTEAAESAGKRLKSRNMIESYIVSNRVE